MRRLIHIGLFVLVTDLAQITTLFTRTLTLLLSITKLSTLWCSFIQVLAFGVTKASDTLRLGGHLLLGVATKSYMVTPPQKS